MNRRERAGAAEPQTVGLRDMFNTPEQHKLPKAPTVGILFVHDEYPWIDSTPIDEAVLYGEVLTHVCYDTKTKIFHLYLDRCILSRKELVEKIIHTMSLPLEPLTQIQLDSHYRCPGCMHRSNE